MEDEAGDEIDTDISTSESDSAKTTTFTTADSGKSFHRALITAVRIVEKAYPFSLTPHESTPVEVKVRTVALNEEQKAVVDAFSEFKEIIDKKDIKAYLDYMEFVAPGSMEEAQKNKPGITEKEIEELVVSEMELLEFTLEDITTDMFSFANTQREFSKPDTNNEYKELTDYADVKIEITKEYEGSKNTYSFFKEA